MLNRAVKLSSDRRNFACVSQINRTAASLLRGDDSTTRHRRGEVFDLRTDKAETRSPGISSFGHNPPPEVL